MLRIVFLLLLLLPGVQLAGAQPSSWDDYDQTADLARLAAHDNDGMRFQLLLSRLRERDALWQPFTGDLEAFGQARYEDLKPLVLERSVSELQQAVAAGRLTYTELATFYVYRIREIESDPARYLNAVISLDPTLLAQAAVADAERRQGGEIATDSLFGIPVLLKDNIGAAGLPTTAGAADLPIDSIAALRRFNEQNPGLRAPYGQELVEMMDGLRLSADELQALRERLQNGARRALERLFADNDLDVLLSVNNRNAGLAALANYPALTLPMGYEEDGRPIGLTLIAPPFSEQRLVGLGARFEVLRRGRRPPARYGPDSNDL